ncbi:MAG: hypothetical protein WC895_02840 [Candidatus Shapirobacteria bacterium]|jgi:hypothetical protein
MVKVFLITIFVIVATFVTLSGLGYTPEQVKTFFVEKLKISTKIADVIVDGDSTATSSAILIQGSIDTILKKYNLVHFKNTKWTGEIVEKINGSIPTYGSPLVISMNNTFKIEELSIDLKNFDWAKQAKAIGITNTNIDGLAISIVGKGKIIYQNPWKTFVSILTRLNIDNNPISVSFVGYIDPKNKKLMFNEAFINKPQITATEYSCFPDPIGCLPPITKSWELKAGELWLRGMTYEFGRDNELILKEPIWDSKQKEYLQKSLEAAVLHKGNVKMEASGLLKVKH